MTDCEYFGNMDKCTELNCMKKVNPCRSCDVVDECLEAQNQSKTHIIATNAITITCDNIYELDLINVMCAIEKYIKNKCKDVPGCKLRQDSGLEYINLDELE